MRLDQRKRQDGTRGGPWHTWGYDANRTRWHRSTYQMDREAAEIVARELERRYAAHPIPT